MSLAGSFVLDHLCCLSSFDKVPEQSITKHATINEKFNVCYVQTEEIKQLIPLFLQTINTIYKIAGLDRKQVQRDR